jgi:hypothetical protein
VGILAPTSASAPAASLSPPSPPPTAEAASSPPQTRSAPPAPCPLRRSARPSPCDDHGRGADRRAAALGAAFRAAAVAGGRGSAAARPRVASLAPRAPPFPSPSPASLPAPLSAPQPPRTAAEARGAGAGGVSARDYGARYVRRQRRRAPRHVAKRCCGPLGFAKRLGRAKRLGGTVRRDPGKPPAGRGAAVAAAAAHGARQSCL